MNRSTFFTRARLPVIAGRQGGYALVGVMVGVVIFFGGVIGIAGMHSQATRSNHDSLQRSQALWLAYELTERIQSNLDAFDFYEPTVSSLAGNFGAMCVTPWPPDRMCNIASTVCTGRELANFDLMELTCGANAGYLVDPELSLVCSGVCDPEDEVMITVSWISRAGGATTRQQVDIAFRRD